MIERLKKKVFLVTSFALGIYLVLFLWWTSPSWWVTFLSELDTWGIIIKTVLTIVCGVLAYFLVNLVDVHNFLDKTFFKERKKVDNYIRKRITTPCREISCARSKRGISKDEERKLMNLFYTFIPKDDTERERAFAYWGEYFVTVNLSFISILAFVVTVAFIALNFYELSHPVPYIILISLILINAVRIKQKKRLLSPAEAQTDRILSRDYDQLKSELPKYRADCQQCPLN